MRIHYHPGVRSVAVAAGRKERCCSSPFAPQTFSCGQERLFVYYQHPPENKYQKKLFLSDGEDAKLTQKACPFVACAFDCLPGT